jgi:hypothetical protein
MHSCRLPDSASRGVVFRIRISPRSRSQNLNGSKCSVRDLCRTDFCKNPRKSASLPCPFKHQPPSSHTKSSVYCPAKIEEVKKSLPNDRGWRKAMVKTGCCRWFFLKRPVLQELFFLSGCVSCIPSKEYSKERNRSGRICICLCRFTIECSETLTHT